VNEDSALIRQHHLALGDEEATGEEAVHDRGGEAAHEELHADADRNFCRAFHHV
jgi:hypothetical protein